jgi:hypothetical protein
MTSMEHPPSTWPTVSVRTVDPPLADKDYVTCMPRTRLRPLIRGIRLTFSPSPTLIARGFPTDWGSHALPSANKRLYMSDLETPLSLQHALHKALAPLRAGVDWPRHAVITSRHFMNNTFTMVYNSRLACGYPTSSILFRLNPTMEASSPSFRAYNMHKTAPRTHNHNSRVSSVFSSPSSLTPNTGITTKPPSYPCPHPPSNSTSGSCST